AAELARQAVRTSREAATTSACATGLGPNRLGPWQVAWFSDELVECLLHRGMAAERLGGASGPAWGSLVAMLPRPGGGYCPIGLLCGFPLWWARLRKPYSDARGAALDPEDAQAFWGGTGKAAKQAVWRQDFMTESAKARDRACARFLVDLEKCYAMVLLALLQATLAVYGGPRQVMVGCFVGEVFVYGGGLIAGDVHANTVLGCVLARVDGAHRRAWAHNHVCIMVDDCLLFMEGHLLDIVSQLGEAAGSFLDGLERTLQMVVSRERMAIVTSTADLRGQDRQLRRWRSKVAAVVVGEGAGRFQALGCLLGRHPCHDPWCEHALKPLAAWAKGLQADASAIYRRALGWAMVEAQAVLDSRGPDALAGRGPAAASLLAAHRLGWHACGPRSWTDDRGMPLDVMVMGKHALARVVEAARVRWLWREVGAEPGKGHLAGGWAARFVRKSLLQ
ncbi:unnamed protein product, partial [Prorocentrum cordatum]